MPDNRLTLTIEAQNLAQAAFKQLQSDVRQANEALKKTDQTARNSGSGIKVIRDELGRFHDAATGRYVSAARAMSEGFTEVERSAGKATQAIKGTATHTQRLTRTQQVIRNYRSKFAETHDFHSYLNGLRRKSVAEATQELTRLEERALDASNQRQRENLIRETQQFVDAYADRGQAFRDLVADAQDLGVELQDAFDLTAQQQRMEDFRDSVAGVIEDLAGITIDHFWGAFTDGSRSAADAVEDFTTRAGDAIRILESDILRLQRFNEDSDLRGERLQEDRDRRIAQLQRQRQALLARQPVGDQRQIERNIQRVQDITARIAETRSGFDVRISRQAEDAERRRARLIEDATTRRERFEARGSDESLFSKLGDSLASSVSNAITSALASGLSELLTKSAFDAGVSLITAALGALGIGDLLGKLGGGNGTDAGTGADTGTGTGDGDTSTQATGDADVDGTIKTLTVDPELTTPNVDVVGIIKSAIQAAAEAYTTPSIDAKGRITSAELSEGATLPSVPGLKAGIENVVLQNNVSLPIVPGLEGQIDTLTTAEAIEDLPNVAGLEGRIDALTLLDAEGGLTLPTVSGLFGEIGSLALKAEGLSLPDVGSLQGTIVSLVLLEDLMLPTVTGLAGVIGSVTPDTDIDLPTLTGLTGQITTVTSGVVVSPQVDVTASISSVLLNPAIDSPVVTGLAGTIDSTALDPTIDLPTVTGLAAQIGSVALAPDIDLPSIRLDATAVVGPVAGGEASGSRQKGADEEDPENPILAGGENISGVINATLNKLFDEPIQIPGVINAVVRTVGGTGGTGGQSADGGGEGSGKSDDSAVEDLEEAVTKNYSTVAELNENVKNLNDTVKNVTNGNLNPALGPTRVDIPDVLTRLNQQTNFTDDQAQRENPGFAEILGAHSQFRPGGGGGGVAGQQQASLRVAFPTEAFNALVNIHTTINLLGKEFASANEHLALANVEALSMRTFIENGMFPALHTQGQQIAGILETMRSGIDRIADAPLVQGFVDAGVRFPNDPTDPTNAALRESPITDVLSQPGLDLFAAQDRLMSLAQGLAGHGPDLSQIGGAGSPLHIKDVDISTTRKVEVVNLPDLQKVQVTNEVSVKQVGTVQVTQAGEWVLQLASGATIPVYVQGGQITADIAGGLEGLAIQLADEEVGLQAVGAI